jgi:hypothetical protein
VRAGKRNFQISIAVVSGLLRSGEEAIRTRNAPLARESQGSVEGTLTGVVDSGVWGAVVVAALLAAGFVFFSARMR